MTPIPKPDFATAAAPTSKRPKEFTGRHAAAIIIAFFAIVICVNLVMATFAISTFGGTIVDNSYVASQKYNQWLEQARAQENHGWIVSDPARVGDHAALTLVAKNGSVLTNAIITASAEHPIGTADPFTLHFTEVRPGEYHSAQAIPKGRWKLKLLITYQGKDMRIIGDIL